MKCDQESAPLGVWSNYQHKRPPDALDETSLREALTVNEILHCPSARYETESDWPSVEARPNYPDDDWPF